MNSCETKGPINFFDDGLDRETNGRLRCNKITGPVMRQVTRSLRFWLTVPSLVVIFALWVGYTMFWAQRSENTARTAFEENGGLAAHLYSGAVADALWQFDARSAQQILTGLSAWPGFIHVQISDQGGEFASFTATRSDGRTYRHEPVTFAGETLLRRGDLVYFSAAVEHPEHGQLGQLVAVFDQRPLEQAIWADRQIATLSAVVGFALLGLFLARIAQSVSMPLVRITQAVEKVADGDLDHLVPAGQRLDEVARLSRALDVFRQNAGQLVTARAEAEANRRVADLAMIDVLTGLANRRAVVQSFSDIENTPVAPDCLKSSIIHIDLDGFKRINDTLGHGAGDHVLKEVAQRLSQFEDKCEFVARIGGDEFVMLVSHRASDMLPQDIAELLVDQLSQPVDYKNQKLRIGASIGIACHKQGAESMADTLVHADIALYRAKALGKGRFVTFDETHRQEIMERNRVSDEILQGIDDNQFIPYFQVIVAAGSHRIVAVEMLARWHHPTRGILAPRHFLELATDLGVMQLIDTKVFAQAMTLFAGWAAEGVQLPRLCINVSITRLIEPSFIDMLKEARAVGIDVDVELLESIYLDEPSEQLLMQLDQIREFGVGLNIDDFGTGHASVAGLIQIGPDKVKIDKRFVAPILQSARGRDLVQTLLGLCALLEIEVVAEGVEEMAQAQMLHDFGCDYLQGFAFMKPGSAAELRKRLVDQQVQIAS